jgi:hypothetical protein
MRDLIVEGRDLQDKISENFRTILKEADVIADSELVKDTDKFSVVIPNSLDALKKITGNPQIDLSMVDEATPFQIFCVIFKKGTTQFDVPQYKHFTVISTENHKLLFFNGANKLVGSSKLFALPNGPGLTKTTFTFGANDGRVIPQKPEGSFDIMKAWDDLYQKSSKDIDAFRAQYKKKIKSSIKKELGIGDDIIVKETEDLAVLMPKTFSAFKYLYDRDEINHKVDFPKDRDSGYQIFLIVFKKESKYYNNKQFKIITVYANDDGEFIIYDYRDKKITMDDLLKITKLSRSIFRYGANNGDIFINKAKSKYKNSIEMLKNLYANTKNSGEDKEKSADQISKDRAKSTFKDLALAALGKAKNAKNNIFK